MSRALAIAAASSIALAACRAPTRASETVEREPVAVAAPPAEEVPREPEPQHALVGDWIVVCGERVPIGTRVILWTDPRGYDAYATEPHFPEELGSREPPKGLRYRPGREATGRTASDVTPGELRSIVDLFVLHYDACGTSRRCFQVLQDWRGLSVHFLLDVDGTLYQTLDLEETAWHARQANPRSIGIEIANIGAFPPGETEPLEQWYARDENGVRLVPQVEPTGVLTSDFVGHPARSERIEGEIQGKPLAMHDFTPEQYATLERLAAALCATFPRIELDAPRDADGQVRTKALSPEELNAFRGVIGHFHVTEDKVDPGPAFDWERFLDGARHLRDLGSPVEPVP